MSITEIEKKLDIIFESDNIYFTKVSYNLLDEYLLMVNDYEVNKLISGNHKTFTREQEYDWVTDRLKDDSILFSMIEKSTGDFIGNIELMSVNEKEGELGICITASMQNKHLGTEGIITFMKYCFRTYNLNKITLKVLKNNPRAIHVYEKVGFMLVGETNDQICMEFYNSN